MKDTLSLSFTGGDQGRRQIRHVDQLHLAVGWPQHRKQAQTGQPVEGQQVAIARPIHCRGPDDGGPQSTVPDGCLTA